MSFRTTGILLIILVALAGVVFVVGRQGGGATGGKGTPTPAPLTTLTSEDVTSIQVTQGERSITLRREGGGWVIRGEEPGEADADSVERAVERLTALKPNRTLTDVSNPTDFGLDPPAWTIILTPQEGPAVVFHVGDETPRGGARYLQVAGDPAVHLVPQFAVEEVQKWLEAPPYPPTPAPTETPSVTPSPTGTPEATPTP